MRFLRRWAARVGGIFRKERYERDFAEEVESHVEMHTADNLRAGMSAQDARRNALMKLGGVTQTQEICRERRGLPMVETFLQDLSYGVRMLRKNPGFAAVAILIMALGIGANTAMFSVVNAVLLKPLAYPEPDRIVSVATLWKEHSSRGQVSAPDYHDWHDQSTAFESMAYYGGEQAAIIVGRSAVYAQTTVVGPEFFRVFHIAPAVGREFSTEEAKQGGTGAAIVSNSFSTAHFGGSNQALGQTIRFGDRTLNVVGVMPAGFTFPDKNDVWLPVNSFIPEGDSRSAHNYRVVARLKPGVPVSQAQTQLTAIGTRLEEKYPDSNQGKNVSVLPLRDSIVGDFRLTLYVMLAAVSVVLLIACANLANMLLAKAVARTREIAIRTAVGAGRGRIVRQLLTESLVMALLAGGIGVALAFWGTRILVAIAPGEVPRLAEAGIDSRVLLFALAVSVAASVLFGLAPALQVLRVDLNNSLKQGSSKTVSGSAADRVRASLVVVEIALSVTLLAGAGLLMKSFLALQSVDLGFRAERVLVMEASVPSVDLDSAKRATRFYKELLGEIRNLAGVQAAGASMATPGQTRSNGGYFIDHLPKEMSVNAPQAVFSVVTPQTFATLDIPLMAGRDFQENDTYEAPFVAIVNEAFVKQSFPGQDPIGHQIYCGLDSLTPMRVVGIVANMRQDGPAEESRPEIFMAYEQHPQPAADESVVVRTAMDPTALTETIRARANALSSDVPVKFTTLQASLMENVATPRFRTVLIGVFAGLALFLAMAGVYGVMSYAVGQRSNEIGLRMALGATPSDVLRLILRQALVLSGAGIAIGLVCAAAVTQLLKSMLFEVKATDPLVYALVAALLAVVALGASYIPARRAMRVDPMVALRYE